MKQKKKREFSKVIVGFCLINGVLWVWASYLLAFLGRTEIAMQLSITALTEIVAVVMGYYLKSLFEKKSLNNNKMRIPDDGSGKYIMHEPQDNNQL